MKAIANLAIKDIVIFASNTVVHISELVNIMWADIDFYDMIVRN